MIRVLSYGGGLDSFAMLLDALARGERPDVCAFVDVSDGAAPGEWPGTYRHIREVVAPVCAAASVELVIINAAAGYPVRDASSLFGWMHARKQIPVAGPNRLCTTIAKVERFERWLSDRYAGQDVEVWIGFDAAEQARVDKDPNAGARRAPKPGEARRVNRFPLVERELCRCRCEALVRKSGHPIPRKSACVFCPYGSLADYQTLARELPEQFERVVELEAQKPPTSNGRKLSIKGYRTLRNAAGEVTGYKAPPLPIFIQGKARGARAEPCAVCGAPKATKATGCDYLEGGAA